MMVSIDLQKLEPALFNFQIAQVAPYDMRAYKIRSLLHASALLSPCIEAVLTVFAS